MIILGIDPGSRILGYGVIERHPEGQESYVASGCIKVFATRDFNQRLVQIYDALQQILKQYKPDVCAVEDVFLAKNAGTALKLGHARGVIVLALMQHTRATVHEYSPRLIKQMLVGKGGVDKAQVNFMVQHRLKLTAAPQVDAGDALAVALCHSQRMHLKDVMVGA